MDHAHPPVSPTPPAQVFLRARRWQQQSRAILLAAEAAAAVTGPAKPLANGGAPQGAQPIGAAGPSGWQVGGWVCM